MRSEGLSVSVCPCPNSPIECLYVPQTTQLTQRATNLWIFVGFSLKLLRCGDPALLRRTAICTGGHFSPPCVILMSMPIPAHTRLGFAFHLHHHWSRTYISQHSIHISPTEVNHYGNLVVTSYCCSINASFIVVVICKCIVYPHQFNVDTCDLLSYSLYHVWCVSEFPPFLSYIIITLLWFTHTYLFTNKYIILISYHALFPIHFHVYQGCC